MSHSIILVISILLIKLPSFNAIIYTSKFYPQGIVKSGERWHTEEPLEGITDGDAFCQFVYQDWWKWYEPKRESARLDPMAPIYEHVDFTRYPSETIDPLRPTDPPIKRPPVPVESFMGLNRKPYDNGGYRSLHWSCFVGCQNVQKTLEWVNAIRITDKRHARARYLFSFLCPEGQIALTYKRKSIREKDTPAEIQFALEVLHQETKRRTRITDYTTIHGDKSPELDKCRCVDHTKERETIAINQIKTRSKIRGVGHERQRATSSRDRKPKAATKPRVYDQPRGADGAYRVRDPSDSKRLRTEGVSSNHPSRQVDAIDEAWREAEMAQEWRIEDLDIAHELGQAQDPDVPIDWQFEEPELLPEIEDLEFLESLPEIEQWEDGEILTEPANPSVQCHDYDYPNLESALRQAVAHVENNPPRARLRAQDDDTLNDTLSATLRAFAGLDQDYSWDVGFKDPKGKGH